MVQLGGQAPGFVVLTVVEPAAPALALVPDEPPTEVGAVPPLALLAPPETLALPPLPPLGGAPELDGALDEQPAEVARRTIPRAVRGRFDMRFVLS